MPKSEYEDTQRVNDALLKADFQSDLAKSISAARGDVMAFFIPTGKSSPEKTSGNIDDITEHAITAKGIPEDQKHERFVYGRDVVKAAIRDLVAQGVLLQSGTTISWNSTHVGV